MEKKILKDIRGKKTPDHIFLRMKRTDLKKLPDEFYLDITIDDIRDASIKNGKKKTW